MALAACAFKSVFRFALNVATVFNGEIVSRVSHITLLRNVKLAAGSGRRYTEYICCPVEALVVAAQPYGSCVTATANCAVAGGPTAMRINPLFSTRLCPVLSPVTTVGQLAPSTARNSGSVPLLLVNKACALAAL